MRTALLLIATVSCALAFPFTDTLHDVVQSHPDLLFLASTMQLTKVPEYRLQRPGAFTLFAPSNAAFREIDEQRYFQLGDVRNSETVGKICGFHCINEPVTKDVLYESGGVVTLEGVLSVGQTKVGDFFGIGGEDDGGVTINGAKIVKSFEVGSSIVHEVDKLVAPEVVWRFLDQTRLPGTTFLRGLFSAIG